MDHLAEKSVEANVIVIQILVKHFSRMLYRPGVCFEMHIVVYLNLCFGYGL